MLMCSRAPPRQCSFSVDESGSFPDNTQRFFILTPGLLLQFPAAAQGTLLSPQLTKGLCQGYTLQGCRRCLLSICLASQQEREPMPQRCSVIASNRRGCYGTEGSRATVALSDLRRVKCPGSLCPLLPSHSSAATRCSQTTRSPVPQRTISHCPTIFFFRHCRFYYLKGMELGNERCGKIPQTKALISIASTLPWISFLISSSSVLGSSLGVIKVLLKLWCFTLVLIAQQNATSGITKSTLINYFHPLQLLVRE